MLCDVMEKKVEALRLSPISKKKGVPQQPRLPLSRALPLDFAVDYCPDRSTRLIIQSVINGASPAIPQRTTVSLVRRQLA